METECVLKGECRMFIPKSLQSIFRVIASIVISLLQWLLVMLLGFSAPVFLLLAFLLLLVAGIFGLAGLAPIPTVLGFAITGFVVFLIPVGGQWFLFTADNLKDCLRRYR